MPGWLKREMSSAVGAGICYSGVQGHIPTPVEQTRQRFEYMTNRPPACTCIWMPPARTTLNFTASLQTGLFFNASRWQCKSGRILRKAVRGLYVCHQLPLTRFSAFGFILLVNACQTVRRKLRWYPKPLQTWYKTLCDTKRWRNHAWGVSSEKAKKAVPPQNTGWGKNKTKPSLQNITSKSVYNPLFFLRKTVQRQHLQ